MRLFIGLGNPGKQYTDTRHNIGFKVIDFLAEQWSIPLNQQKFNGIFGIGYVNGEKVWLVKPLTYMNLSGDCVRPLMEYFKIEVEDIVVIYDDLDLPVGKLRLRGKGSAGGHNGIKSLIAHLGTQEFNRIRVGIDRPKNGQKVADYVLSNFSKEEYPEVVESIKKSAQACEGYTKDSFLSVMNKFN